MTLNEAGLRLRQSWPELERFNLSNEQLAQLILNRYPRLYDLVSPTARKVKELSDEPIQFDRRRWFEGSEQTGLNEDQAIQNRRSHIAALHEAELVIKASSLGIPVTALHDIAVENNRHHHVMELERFRRDNGLEGGERARLTPHYLIRQLAAEVMDLIDQRDKEAHPDKREILTLRIKHLKEEIDGRAKQAMVQAGGGTGVEFTDKDAERDGVSGESLKADVEPVSSPKPRVGF